MFFLATQMIVVIYLVNLNFFGEKHGKSSRDTHFSIVSRFIKNKSTRDRLCSSADIVDAIRSGQEDSNETRLAKGKLILMIISISRVLNF